MTIKMTKKETIAVVKAFAGVETGRNRNATRWALEEVDDAVYTLMGRMGYMLNKDWCFVQGSWDKEKGLWCTSSALPHEQYEEVGFQDMEFRMNRFVRTEFFK